MLLFLVILGVVTTLIYAAFFGGAPKTRGASESPGGGSPSSPQPGATGSGSMGDAAYASSWTTHPALSTVDGEDELMKNGFKMIDMSCC